MRLPEFARFGAKCDCRTLNQKVSWQRRSTATQSMQPDLIEVFSPRGGVYDARESSGSFRDGGLAGRSAGLAYSASVLLLDGFPDSAEPSPIRGVAKSFEIVWKYLAFGYFGVLGDLFHFVLGFSVLHEVRY